MKAKKEKGRNWLVRSCAHLNFMGLRDLKFSS
jgi:hypothetical protein